MFFSFSFRHFIILTIISTRVKYDRKNKKRNESRRNEEGLTSRQQGKKDRVNSILELKDVQKCIENNEFDAALEINEEIIKKYFEEKNKMRNT